jgi:hypothetical protein
MKICFIKFRNGMSLSAVSVPFDKFTTDFHTFSNPVLGQLNNLLIKARYL